MELRDYWMPKICKQFMSNDYYDDCFDFLQHFLECKLLENSAVNHCKYRLTICPYNQNVIKYTFFHPGRFVLHHTMLQPEVIMAII